MCVLAEAPAAGGILRERDSVPRAMTLCDTVVCGCFVLLVTFWTVGSSAQGVSCLLWGCLVMEEPGGVGIQHLRRQAPCLKLPEHWSGENLGRKPSDVCPLSGPGT